MDTVDLPTFLDQRLALVTQTQRLGYPTEWH